MEKYREIKIDGGFASAKVTFYRDGIYVVEGRAWSNSKLRGVKASVFFVGLDKKHRAVFVSEKFDIPTACSTLDACSSDTRKSFNGTIDHRLASHIEGINIYLNSRGEIGGYRESIVRTVREAYKTCDDISQELKTSIKDSIL
ncbi:MAG: hypothetical protein AAFO04_19425 [Cyanobacteria bacterium J06592_8]